MRLKTAGRRSIAFALAAAVSAATCSCGNADEAGQAREGPPTVGFVLAAEGLNFADEMAAGFRVGVDNVGGVKRITDGPPIVDPPRQVKIFEAVAARAPDGVAVFTLHPEIFTRALAEASAGGLPIIAVDNPPNPGSQVGLFVGNDNHELGAGIAEEIANRLPADASGTIVLGASSPGAAVLESRANGMRERLKERLPGVDVIGPFDTKQEPADNLAAWRSLVEANPDALAFLGTGDADGYNLAQIRREAKATWLAAGFDLDPRSLAGVRAGHLLLMSPEHFLKGAVAGTLQAQYATSRKELPKGWAYTPGLAVTPANVAAIERRQQSDEARAAWLEQQLKTLLDGLPENLRPLEKVR